MRSVAAYEGLSTAINSDLQLSALIYSYQLNLQLPTPI
jgi:hypothetical protein